MVVCEGTNTEQVRLSSGGRRGGTRQDVTVDFSKVFREKENERKKEKKISVQLQGTCDVDFGLVSIFYELP